MFNYTLFVILFLVHNMNFVNKWPTASLFSLLPPFLSRKAGWLVHSFPLGGRLGRGYLIRDKVNGLINSDLTQELSVRLLYQIFGNNDRSG